MSRAGSLPTFSSVFSSYDLEIDTVSPDRVPSTYSVRSCAGWTITVVSLGDGVGEGVGLDAIREPARRPARAPIREPERSRRPPWSRDSRVRSSRLGRPKRIGVDSPPEV